MLLLRVHAGPHPRRACPVSIDLDLDSNTRFTLFQEPGHRPRYAQLEPSTSGSRLTWMVTRLAAGEVQEYRLERTPRRRRPSPRVRWQNEAGHYQALLEGQVAAGWNLTASSPGLAALFPASNPPLSLIDHLCQLPDVLPIPCDRSKVLHVDAPMPGAVFGRLSYRCQWLGRREERLAQESVCATVFATPAHLRLVDLEFSIHATTGPVKFAVPSSAGLLRLQLAKPLSSRDIGVITASDARSAEELNRKPAGWCLLDTSAIGLAIFAHPENPGGPCDWYLASGTLRADPFGSLARCQPVLHDLRPQLATGETMTFRYRICVHAEKHRLAAIRQHYADFAFPPQIECVTR